MHRTAPKLQEPPEARSLVGHPAKTTGIHVRGSAASSKVILRIARASEHSLGSAVMRPSRSVQISIRAAQSAAATSAELKSDPPGPGDFPGRSEVVGTPST